MMKRKNRRERRERNVKRVKREKEKKRKRRERRERIGKNLLGSGIMGIKDDAKPLFESGRGGTKINNYVIDLSLDRNKREREGGRDLEGTLRH